jgi:hypothetical protein
MTAIEYRLLALTERGIIFSVSPTGQIIPIRATYFLVAAFDDPLIQNVCLDRGTAERKSLEIRGLGDAIQRPMSMKN